MQLEFVILSPVCHLTPNITNESTKITKIPSFKPTSSQILTQIQVDSDSLLHKEPSDEENDEETPHLDQGPSGTQPSTLALEWVVFMLRGRLFNLKSCSRYWRNNNNNNN